MTLAIIGGTGLTQIDALRIKGRQQVTTPYGEPSADYVHGVLQGLPVVFLARHGDPHRIPPHLINYRANIHGLKSLGVTEIIAVAAVGGITTEMAPASLAVPHQIIDYSHDREQTFFADNLDHVTHIDFTFPYTPVLRQRLLSAAEDAGIPVVDHGTYGCTQGPRLETAAEITRLERDGCDLVGMTGMPEAALARELDIAYASLAVVANWAAGKTEGEISMADIARHVQAGMGKAVTLLKRFITGA